MAAKEKEKVSMDWRKLTVLDMSNYIKDNHPDNDTIDWFFSFNKDVPIKKKAQKLDGNGQPIVSINKKNKKYFVSEYVEVKGEGTKKQFQVLKAKHAFYDRYKDEIDFINPPKAKGEPKKKKTEEALEMLLQARQ